jgi:protein tyrosine phosphatase
MQETSVSIGGSQSVLMRTFMLRNGAEPFMSMREIVMLHYEGWPDFGSPTQPESILGLLALLDQVLTERGRKSSPVLMHCSAGCGRTGAFCTIDSVINQFEDEMDGITDDDDLIYQRVLRFREQRMSMVQTLRQFVLCYECVLHYLLGTITAQDTRMEVG